MKPRPLCACGEPVAVRAVKPWCLKCRAKARTGRIGFVKKSGKAKYESRRRRRRYLSSYMKKRRARCVNARIAARRESAAAIEAKLACVDREKRSQRWAQ